VSGAEEDERHLQGRLLSEIDEELRRRRIEGDLLPSFEHELDEAFEQLTPGSSEHGGHDASIELAEQAGHVDIEAPVASNLLLGEVPKRVVRRLVSWYLGHVVQQVTRFTSATTKALHSIDDRLSELERDTEVKRRLSASRGASGGTVDPGEWATLVVELMSGLEGRVLHTECGNGALLRALADAGVDAYGVDPRPDALDRAARVGVDVRLTSSLEHLASLDAASLGGLVLTGFVDHLTMGAQTELMALSARALRVGGVLALLCVNPDTWGRSLSAVEADLSPGRPLHAETWAYLLERHGFSSVRVHAGSPTVGLEPVRGSGPAWDAASPAWDTVNSNLARLDELLFPSTSFAVVGVWRD
jgi:SAM-dependent methyltransferase